MRLDDASSPFDEVLNVSPGVKLSGHISNLDDGAASLSFPVRRLLVDPRSPAAPGMVVTTSGGFRYLLAEQGEDLQNGVVKKAFVMIRLDRSDSLIRYTSTTDAATGLQKDSTPTDLGSIWYQARTPILSEGVLHIPEARYQLITGFPLQIKDQLGPLRVLHVDQRLGVYFAEAQ